MTNRTTEFGPRFESTSKIRTLDSRWPGAQSCGSGVCCLAVRELARRVERDVKRVDEDVQVLANLGLVERTDDGAVCCPFTQVHIDMRLSARQHQAA